MDSRNLHLDIDYVGSSGVILSPEQKASLQTSLIILQNNLKCQRVYFWGKILGVKDDYFIAQTVSENEIGEQEKKTHYSKDCTTWGLLPPASEQIIEQARYIKGRFTGDPSYEFEHTEVRRVDDEEAPAEEETAHCEDNEGVEFLDNVDHLEDTQHSNQTNVAEEDQVASQTVEQTVEQAATLDQSISNMSHAHGDENEEERPDSNADEENNNSEENNMQPESEGATKTQSSNQESGDEESKVPTEQIESKETVYDEEFIQMKEEDRLAAVIHDIDHDVRIVPRGAFTLSPTGKVSKNRSFEGLTVAEAAKLCNYFHFREPVALKKKKLVQKANLDKAIDCMDPIDEDVPKGSWSLQFERGSSLTTLRSLFWPGYTFYHVPGTANYGSIYVGTGEKNIDLPFML